MNPPQMKFLTKMFHPNISHSGDICLDTLQSNWSPVLSLEKAILSVLSLLTDPNADHGLNDEAVKLFHSNRPAFNAKVRSYVSQYGEEVPEDLACDEEEVDVKCGWC